MCLDIQGTATLTFDPGLLVLLLPELLDLRCELLALRRRRRLAVHVGEELLQLGALVDVLLRGADLLLALLGGDLVAVIVVSPAAF